MKTFPIIVIFYTNHLVLSRAFVPALGKCHRWLAVGVVKTGGLFFAVACSLLVETSGLCFKSGRAMVSPSVFQVCLCRHMLGVGVIKSGGMVCFWYALTLGILVCCSVFLVPPIENYKCGNSLFSDFLFNCFRFFKTILEKFLPNRFLQFLDF